jgi:hypothetical protein
MNDKYNDILHMEHHVSTKRPRMSMKDRAAQFSPFAALTGHDAAIKETARLTEAKIMLDESEKAILDDELRIIAANIDKYPEIKLVYFEKDIRKDGGCYRSINDIVVKIDYYEREIIMKNGERIKFDDVYKIDGEILQKMYNEYI